MEARPLKIYTLIPKIMSEIGAIAKSGRNTDDEYDFQKIDDVVARLQPLLVKNGVSTIPNVLESHETIEQKKKGVVQIRVKQKVKYSLCADDGSMIESTVEGEAIDESDKATNKAFTAAYKNMCKQVFCLRVKDMDDADAKSPKMNFKPEKTPAPALQPTPEHAKKIPKDKDFKIPEGKFKGKLVSKVRRHELEEYVNHIDTESKKSGMVPPDWFMRIKRALAAAA